MRNVRDDGTFSREQRSLLHVFEKIFDELQRLQRDLQLRMRIRLAGATVQRRQEVELEIGIARNRVARAGAACDREHRQESHRKGLDRGVRVDVQIAGQRDRHLLACVREVDVLRARRIAPADAEHVAVGEKCVRPDEHAARVEETVVGEAADHAEMRQQDRLAAQRRCRGDELAHALGRLRRVVLLDERARAWTVGPDVDLAQASRHVCVLEIPVGVALDLLGRERAGKIRDRARELGGLRGVEELRVARLGRKRKRFVRRHGWLY